MKKILIALILMFTVVGCGCQVKNDAGKAVQTYLDKYTKHDAEVLGQLDSYVANEELSEPQKAIYKEVLRKQYKDLKYEIANEDYEGDDATVTVKVTVYDLYKVQKASDEYLEVHQDEFNDETGNYDKTLYLNYKLEQMKNNTETVEYTVDFFVTKTDGTWVVAQPSSTVLEKIHGIYNYDNK